MVLKNANDVFGKITAKNFKEKLQPVLAWVSSHPVANIMGIKELRKEQYKYDDFKKMVNKLYEKPDVMKNIENMLKTSGGRKKRGGGAFAPAGFDDDEFLVMLMAMFSIIGVIGVGMAMETGPDGEGGFGILNLFLLALLFSVIPRLPEPEGGKKKRRTKKNKSRRNRKRTRRRRR